ncbi:MAG: hypothetical protein RI945_77 [Candidatus Parcubacteria bacterium]|jgi:hypothetical protein
MNQNYLKKYLDIKVLPHKTTLEYWNDDVLSFIHEYDIGLHHVEQDLVSEISLSNWVSGVIYALHQISLQDRVPTFIYLTTEKYGMVFEKVLKSKNTYSQFFLENGENEKGVHVIIKKINYANANSLVEDFSLQTDLKAKNNLKTKQYERYTKIISQFKV